MSNNTIIELKHVSKVYTQRKKSIPALDDFSLEVSKGSFVSIMGPSGCGKSTVTKIIAGIENLDSGQLILDGQDMSSGVTQEMKRRIGYVFQWHNLTEWRTVEGNLFFPLEMMGEKRDESWDERAKKYLDLVGLYKYRKVYPHELSGGMKQRVGIARALMLSPDILVFDQPFGALDAITRKVLAESFSKAMREEGKTMLMVTNSADEVVRYCDKVYVMTPGPGRNKVMIETGITPEQRSVPNYWLQDEFLDLKKTVIRALNDDKADKAPDGKEI